MQRRSTRPCARMLSLSRREREALERQAQSDQGSADSARHARLVLLLAAGHTWADIRAQLGCSDSYIARWSKRFAAERLAGLYARHAGRERYKVTDKLERRVLEQTTQQTPADGSRYWSSRKLAAALGGAISHMTVARIWAKHGIKPHRLESLWIPADPAFNASAADIVGLYLNRPRHAAIFCIVDRYPAPDPPAGADQAAMPGRPGALALYRTLKNRHEEGSPRRPKRSGAAELAAFLAHVLAHRPAEGEMHIIADHSASNRSRYMIDLLATYPQVHLHPTFTYAAWIAQMDRTLGKIELALVASGASRNVHGLRTAIMHAVRRSNQRPMPLKWAYFSS